MEAEVVYFRIFDLGAPIDLEKVRRAMPGLPLASHLAREKATPKYFDLPEPIVVAIDERRSESNLGPRTLKVVAKLYGLGALSVMIRTPAQVHGLGELTPFAELALRDDGHTKDIGGFAWDIYQGVLKDLKPFLGTPYEIEPVDESYIAYCIGGEPDLAPVLVKSLRHEVTALLANDPHPGKLSDGEINDTWRHWYSYYEDDLAVLDLHAALVVEPSGRYEDTLAVVELANLQLLELRTYDIYLDRILERAYDDLELFFSRRGLLRRGGRVLKELGDVRMDLAEMTDATENITKFFGDWFLAKVYRGCKEKLDLEAWISRVNEKQAALSEIYDTAQHMVEARRTIILEALIVLLFIIDLAVLLFPGQR